MSYAHPPISEALLDIQTDDLGCDLQILRALGNEEPGFPEVRDLNITYVPIAVGVPQSTVPATGAHSSQVGFQFWSADKTRVWQARTNGFNLSHCRPYENWEALVTEAREKWTRFRSRTEAHPRRLAVRYINRFDIPLRGKLDLRDYFAFLPQIPDDIDTGLNTFFMQIVLPQTDLNAAAVLNQSAVPPAGPGLASIVLDIDLFRTIEVPQDEDEIWSIFDGFRARKNHIFESCITEAARDLIR